MTTIIVVDLGGFMFIGRLARRAAWAVTVAATATTLSAQQPAPPLPLPAPTMAEAMKALDLARAAAVKLGVGLSCAVVDSRGDLVALARMDNARFFTTDVARGKAQVSAMFGQPSGNLAQFGTNPAFANLNITAQGRLYPVQGAVPIARGSQLIGGIGCSGGSGQQDEDAAKAGAAGF
ncbi:MAG TPA: heme-binding protein [Vicinamibacterales bacterium]